MREFNRTDVTNVQVKAVLNSPQAGTFTLNVTASGSLPATFTRILGQNQFALNSNADFNWGIKKLELALALDNTGSMGQSGKITQLKTAAKNLLTTLKAAAKQPGDVKVSIIPFDTDGQCRHRLQGRVLDRLHGKEHPEGSVGPAASWTATSRRTCPTRRRVSGSASTLFPAKQCNTSLVPMMPLTDVLDETGFTNLNSKIDSMQASGNTNVTIGLAWGWHSLTPNLPLSQAAEPSPDRDKVVVLLTDGTNTQNRWSSERLADRSAHGARLHQCQERQHQDLHGAGDRRRQDAAQELRQQAEHVLRGEPGERAQLGVLLDRAEPGEFAPREVT